MCLVLRDEGRQRGGRARLGGELEGDLGRLRPPHRLARPRKGAGTRGSSPRDAGEEHLGSLRRIVAPVSPPDIRTTPRDRDLGLIRIGNRTGLSVSMLPNGSIFMVEHAQGDRAIMINQVLGSPIAGRIGRIYARIRNGALVAL